MPLANESVIFGASTLMKSGAASGHAGGSKPSAAASQTNCTLLEFLVLKHAAEWNNFAERIEFQGAAALIALMASVSALHSFCLHSG